MKSYLRVGFKLVGFMVTCSRSSHHRYSIIKGFFRACNFIKKETLAQVFPCEFCEISKTTFFTEHLQTTASDDPADHGYAI